MKKINTDISPYPNPHTLEDIQPRTRATMPTVENVNTLITKDKYVSPGLWDNPPPPNFACYFLEGSCYLLYTALWKCDFGIARQTEIGKSFEWSKSKTSRLAAELCKDGLAYRLKTPEGHGRTSNQVWMIVFAEQIPESMRRTEPVLFKDLPKDIQRCLSERILAPGI